MLDSSTSSSCLGMSPAYSLVDESRVWMAEHQGRAEVQTPEHWPWEYLFLGISSGSIALVSRQTASSDSKQQLRATAKQQLRGNGKAAASTQLNTSIINPRPVATPLGSNMAFIDFLSLILSLAVLSSLRLLLPRNIVPRVSKSFEEAEKAVERAEAINIPYVSEYQANLAIQRRRFLHMRTESHSSPGFFHQLYLFFLYGLSWRLYDVESRVNAIKRKIELAEDELQLASERQLAFLTNTNAQSVSTTALLPSAADMVIPIPMTNATDLTQPPRAVRRRAYH